MVKIVRHRQGISAWLHGPDLKQYAENFSAANIEREVLPHLSESELNEIGINAADHRRKILHTLPKLSWEREAAPSAELRYLTVVFCDLVGSTRLAESLGAEAFWDLLVRYYSAVETATVPLGGHIAQHHGDGVLIYFGYPNSLEDAALRGVLSACRTIKEVAELKTLRGQRVEARVGVSSGLVVVDKELPSTNLRAGHAFGPTVNLAARLQTVAKPGHVVASETTIALVGHHFRTRSLGKHRLKGIKAPLAVFDIEGECSADLSVAITSQPIRVPFFGRARELGKLEEAWSAVKAGGSRAAHIGGEPGIGKSRLVTEFLASIERSGYSARRISCQPQSEAIALHAFLDSLRAEKKQLAFSTRLLDAFDAHHGRNAIARRERRSALIDQLVDHFVAGDRPRIFWCDDIHWADPSSLEALSRLLARRLPGLLVITSGRDEAGAKWRGIQHPSEMDRLELEPLPPADTKKIIAHLLSGERPGKTLISTLANRSEGVPLFAEELALELRPSKSGRVRKGREASVPLSLQQRLQARIARLTVGRHLMRLMSCLGRSVSLPLLRELCADDRHIDEALEEITAVGLAEVQLSSADGEDNLLVCRHQLILDCAYEMILRRDRVFLHGRIADLLLKRAADGIPVHPLMQAEHLERAERLKEAAVVYAAAGRRAAAQSADTEAASLHRRALDLARRSPASADGWQLEFEADTLLSLYPAIVGAAGYSTANAEVIARIEELVPRLRGADRLLSTVFIRWLDHLAQGDIDTAHGLTLGLADAVPAAEKSVQALMVNRMLGSTYMFRGEFEKASAHLGSFIEAFEDDPNLPALNQFGATDNYITVLCCLAAISAFMDDAPTAHKASQRAVSAAENHGHIHTLCHTLCFGAALPAGLRQDWEQLALHQKRLTAIAKKHQLGFWASFAMMLKGISSAARGDVENGGAIFYRARNKLVGQGFHFMGPTFHMVLLLASGKALPPVSLALLEKELASGERWGLLLLNKLRTGSSV